MNSQIHADNAPAADHAGPEAIVIYDGQCNFCRANIHVLQKFDGKQRLAFLSLHETSKVAEIAPQLTHDQMMEQMYVIADDGQAYGGAAALRRLSRMLPRLWLAAPLLHIPGSLPIWQAMYRIVARQRYRLAGKSKSCDGGACEVHFGRASSDTASQQKNPEASDETHSTEDRQPAGSQSGPDESEWK